MIYCILLLLFIFNTISHNPSLILFVKNSPNYIWRRLGDNLQDKNVDLYNKPCLFICCMLNSFIWNGPAYASAAANIFQNSFQIEFTF